MQAFFLRYLMMALSLLLNLSYCLAQDNYEIQVYGSETVPNYSTMFELHSNVTLFGNNWKKHTKKVTDPKTI